MSARYASPPKTTRESTHRRPEEPKPEGVRPDRYSNLREPILKELEYLEEAKRNLGEKYRSSTPRQWKFVTSGSVKSLTSSQRSVSVRFPGLASPTDKNSVEFKERPRMIAASPPARREAYPWEVREISLLQKTPVSVKSGMSKLEV
jgi:hypothetical protein